MAINRRRFLKNASLLASAYALGGCRVFEPAARPRLPAKIELLGSYWTIAGGAVPATDKEYSPFDFRDRAEALAAGGYTGMGIWHADLDKILEAYTLKEMKQILDDNGIVHFELEFLFDWFVADSKRRKQSDLQRVKLLNAAEALSARHIKVGDFFNTPASMPQLIEAFAGLCANAANAGTRILFELMPFSMLTSLRDTLTMFEGAGADNGGIILDTWHIVKLGISNEEIARIPKRFLLGVELNDGYLKTPPGMTLQDETTGHRQLCGEGEFDMQGFIAAVQATGYDGPWGVEVINNELKTWPLDKIVSRSYETTMAQFGS